MSLIQDTSMSKKHAFTEKKKNVMFVLKPVDQPIQSKKHLYKSIDFKVCGFLNFILYLLEKQKICVRF